MIWLVSAYFSSEGKDLLISKISMANAKAFLYTVKSRKVEAAILFGFKIEDFCWLPVAYPLLLIAHCLLLIARYLPT